MGTTASASCHGASCSNATTKDYCYSARIRSTVLQGLPFGGVPTVLALDFMCFLALLFVFSILRKVAWDYGRLALVTDADRHRRQRRFREEREYVASALHSDNHDHYERLTSVSSSVDFDQRDNGFCSWLTAIFRIKDDEIREKCGADAVHYLSFQRHIIGLLVAVGVLSVGIVLPVNFSGDLLENNAYSFGRTTIANLASNNNLLWLHTTFAFLYLLLTVYSMRRHTSKMRYKEDDLVKRTLFINGISKYAEPKDIKKHFEEAYANCTVLEARPCYNVARLMFLDTERKKAERGRMYFTHLQHKENETSMINPKPCGHLCCCVIKGCEQVEAIEYYTRLSLISVLIYLYYVCLEIYILLFFLLSYSSVCQIDNTEVNAVDGTQNGRPATTTLPHKTKYIAQVLQDASAITETTADSEDTEEPGSQDEEMINADNTLDAEFQSCEDSLIENEIHQ
ncbi:mechanosensitive cation channel TMEM63B [Ascaphus truei]|uniref:mechanosensitive cation channel TMEM63B n=1 Tax=Ascaphus truei TaxID=8439 RepID=UPI003F5A98AE